MNTYIKNSANELIGEHLKGGIYDVDGLLSKVQNEIYAIKSEKDTLLFLTLLLETNNLQFDKHNEVCTNKVDCLTEHGHIKVNYFLQQELEQLNIIVSDNFTSNEKGACNEKLDQIIQTIKDANEVVFEQVEELKAELNELKYLYVLGKKNWKQQFVGKMESLVFSGVVTEITAKPIIENILKPGFDFVTGRLLE